MPVTAKGKNIFEKATGKKVGHSRTPEMAEKAARTRNAILHGWKPTRRYGPKKPKSASY